MRGARHALAALSRASPKVQVSVGIVLIIATWFTLNLAYQVIRKPSELFFPVSGTLSKTPSETWRQYAPLFRENSTATMTPELLAALAQAEAAGNPIVRTYWRWQFSWNPFEWYAPASSAVGMYQITNGTFVEAKRYCIHQHAVAETGPWYDVHACWFNALYTRVIPSHAIEMTAALLDHEVAGVLARRRVAASSRQKEDLAAAIHLCGAGGGDEFVRRGFAASGQRCGDQSLAGYLREVDAMKRQFVLLSHAR